MRKENIVLNVHTYYIRLRCLLDDNDDERRFGVLDRPLLTLGLLEEEVNADAILETVEATSDIALRPKFISLKTSSTASSNNSRDPPNPR